ncbi:MAG: GNAT family N-acetyltransferase [Actinomycetota bacterium]|nr:GNAT family N-acetyltransferase [Actinomycetota bacterium]
MTAVSLRPTEDRDFEAIFELESDVVGADMIALLPRMPGDLAGFQEHWQRLRADATVVRRTIEVDGAFGGYVVSFLLDGERQVGYWIARELWGRGIATEALRLFLSELTERPLWGRVARANRASRRVLEHAGFGMIATTRVLSSRLGVQIDELVLRLD